MTRKRQVVALVESDIATRLDTLRIVTKQSRARVLEDLLAEALAVRETRVDVEADIARVHRLADNAGMSVEEYVAAYAAMFSRETYGPGLEALEAGRVKIKPLKAAKTKTGKSAGKA